jgi:hypothetical protein
VSAFFLSAFVQQMQFILEGRETGRFGAVPTTAILAVMAVALFEANRRLLPRRLGWITFGALGLLVLRDRDVVVGTILLLQAAAIGWLGPRRDRAPQ